MRRFTGISATLFACVASCGDDSGSRVRDAAATADAALHDATVRDAAPDATPMGDVTVTTLARCCTVAPGTPVAAVPVIVVQPDGTLGTGGVTDATGTLTLHGVVEGASVTVAYPEDADSDTQITTTLGVKPGDHLTYGDHYYSLPETGSGSGTVTLTVPTLAAATLIVVNSECGMSSGSGTTIPVLANCRTATAPISVLGFDGSNNVVASGFLAAAAYTPGATDTLAAWTTNTANDVTIAATGLGAEVIDADLELDALSPTRDFENDDDPTIVAGASSEAFTIPLGFPRIVGDIDLERDGGFRDIEAFRTVAAGSNAISIAQPAMPWLGPITANAAVGKAEWLQTAGTYGGAVLSAGWERTVTVGETSTDHYYNWHVIIPPGQTSVDFGTAPAALAAYLPTATDNINVGVELIDLGSATTYDALRGVPEWELEDPESAVEAGDQTSVDFTDGGEGPKDVTFVQRALQQVGVSVPHHHHRARHTHHARR